VLLYVIFLLSSKGEIYKHNKVKKEREGGNWEV